ncbi:hypothetical protein PGT21_004022 [Puccinia graminis f. sp. tritici]|uniref:Uncharacterized protein n=1 Tax=Puccinia graminis f. sp. tritici TaxID=56615 RepID=A0A5B0S940_PUCGR|nr:hypothetical protein PGT21_004022 [Puccinia graminis f. sp. tritici]KAA1134292.1 hypothetical protein PGTUg99_034713 [Puccinia graminis f. sp. tritici]
MDEDIDVHDAPDTRPPPKPTCVPPSSVFLTFMASLIGNPMNRSPEGAIVIDPNTAGVLGTMMEAEAARLTELDKRMDQLTSMFQTLDNRLKSVEDARSSAPTPSPHPGKSSYAKVTGPPTAPRAPTILPPPKEALKSLKPGKAVIHSDPKQSEIQKVERGFLVQRANEVLLRMDAQVNGEKISIRAAQVLKSGDVCFFSKNRAHQKWLMENKHIWSKEVHPHLEATPSTFSVIAHGIPKSFNPLAPTSIPNLSAENNFNTGDLLRVKWLADNADTPKQAERQDSNHALPNASNV